jgi:glycogen operon protein
MASIADRLLNSTPHPLGAYADGRGVHFAVFSPRAEKLELCLFDAAGRRETTRLTMPDCCNGIWHGYLEGARPGQCYGYRAYGPYEPKQGLRFNHHKLLLDPYARGLAGTLRWHNALYGYRVGSPRADLSFDRRDSVAYAPKSVVVEDYFDWGNDHPPQVPWSDTVIYELHLRGFTRLRNDLPEHDRGTFGALGHPTTIDYLKSLGITTVELLPIHAFAADRHLQEQGLTNYWGYNTLAYFAPHAAYLSDGTLGQLKWAVKQLHAAGIEVILDVVYNHTCEGSELGPTLCWRGLDNGGYYRLLPDNPRHYINDTGCGNTVNFSHPRVIQWAMDSLRYWVQEFHVDGFRFDLGVTLGREQHGFDPGCGFFDALLQDPVLARVKLISEPWDVGPGGYQIGHHPAGFAEWNGRYRDDVRGYWRGDEGLRSVLAGRLLGSADLFDHDRRQPWSSVNFVTAHDGYTLNDLVSYNHKHNEANGENNGDGSDHNFSFNWGHEGPTDDPAVTAQRDKLIRNFFATLLCSQGTPMLLAGDEFGQTQHGNNNAYCQDNELAWLDWSLPFGARGAGLRAFVARLIALRRRQPLLRGRYYRPLQTEFMPGVHELFWFDERGTELRIEDWHNSTARLLGLRRLSAVDDENIDVLLLLFNSDTATHTFRLPGPPLDYRILIATHDPAIGDEPLPGDRCDVPAHAVALIAARTTLEQLSAQADDNGAADGTESPARHGAGSLADDTLRDDEGEDTP